MLADLKKLKTQLEFGLQQQRMSPSAAITAATTAAQQVVDTGGRRPAPGTGVFTASDKRRKPDTALIVLLAVAAVALAVYWLVQRGRSADRATPFATFKVSKLTTTGKASFAAISPDGKYAVHVMGAAGQPSLRLRHIATGSDKEIVPAIRGMMSGLRFSKDGSYIYYVQFIKDEVVLYRVPVLGGMPQKLVADIDTAISFSPDGAQMTYVRGMPLEGQAALMIANADGSGEQRLATFAILYAYPTLSASLLQTWGLAGRLAARPS